MTIKETDEGDDPNAYHTKSFVPTSSDMVVGVDLASEHDNMVMALMYAFDVAGITAKRAPWWKRVWMRCKRVVRRLIRGVIR